LRGQESISKYESNSIKVSVTDVSIVKRTIAMPVGYSIKFSILKHKLSVKYTSKQTIMIANKIYRTITG